MILNEIPSELIEYGIMIIGFCLIIVLILQQRRFRKPYQASSCVLTLAEQKFYRALQSALGDRTIILAKVRVADFISVKPNISGKAFWRYFSRISQKHIDFVLLDPKTFKTLSLIELDDRSHNTHERIKRDQFIKVISKKENTR